MKKSFRQIIITVILVSFFTSSAAGFLAGSIGGKYLVDWWTEGQGGGTSNSGKVNILTEEEAIVKVVEQVSPAVVSIIISKDLPVIEQYYANPFGDDFGFPFNFQIPQYRQKGTEKKEIGGGTGFFISEDGLILTNKHVVNDEEAEYTVLTNDAKRYTAQVLARDPIKDLAILKIAKTDTPIVELGDSDSLKIGQTVVAIGNALGEFRNTVSRGVISGLSRSVNASGGGLTEQLTGVIQTDAAINKGNSGGPLLDINGKVIGVNTAIAEGAQNIGFAIPVNEARKDIIDIKEKGKIVYPFLGVRYMLIDSEVKEKKKLSVDYGALIVSGENEPAVVPSSPAEKAGLKENDIILEVDGIRITQEHSLAYLIQKYDVGDEVTLKVRSADADRTIKVRLAERQE